MIMKNLILLLFAFGNLFLAGCAGRISPTSKLMQNASPGFQSPPPGKSLVLIHRPRNSQGRILYTAVWDSRKFIADLGNGHSLAYICEPGQHYFINRSTERTGVVEAQLLPDKIYTLWLNIAGSFIASFQLEPVKPGDKAWKKVLRCEKENAWVSRGNESPANETLRQSEIDIVIKDFVQGSKQDRLRHLAATDYR